MKHQASSWVADGYTTWTISLLQVALSYIIVYCEGPIMLIMRCFFSCGWTIILCGNISGFPIVSTHYSLEQKGLLDKYKNMLSSFIILGVNLTGHYICFSHGKSRARCNWKSVQISSFKFWNLMIHKQTYIPTSSSCNKDDIFLSLFCHFLLFFSYLGTFKVTLAIDHIN